MKTYLIFWARMILTAVTGSKKYLFFIVSMAALVAFGLNIYIQQLHEGLLVTHMTNEVPWGLGIASFIYFEGVGAASVLLVFPAYIYRNKDLREVVLIGELLAVVAVLCCLLFIFTDIGRPDRFWHMMPGLWGGLLNLPDSLLAWDVIVFNGYLVLNLHIPGYILYKMYLGESPKKVFYFPFVLIAIAWAVGMLTVTAFLLSGLGVRGYWNTSVMAPRFLISAFTSGPAFLYLIFTVVKNNTALKVKDTVFDTLRRILTYTVIINLFIFCCEIFKELYTNTLESASLKYLLFGYNGRGILTPFIWSSLVMQIVASLILATFRAHQKQALVRFACLMVIVGIWIEKAMGLVFPGFIPSPLGTYMEYSPSWHEIVLGISIFALGAMLFTMMTKVAIEIQTGSLRESVKNI